MKKILFFDNNITRFINQVNYSEKFISDYFDIEIQKILPIIGYSYKKNPRLLMPNKTINSMYKQIDFCCNLNAPLDKNTLQPANTIGIVFDCYM